MNIAIFQWVVLSSYVLFLDIPFRIRQWHPPDSAVELKPTASS